MANKPLGDYSDQQLVSILMAVKTIALVGASDNEARPSNEVLKFLLHQGYDVIPVNPLLEGQKIAGQNVAASLSDIKRPIDMVDVFRNSNAVAGVVDETLNLTPAVKVIWMQLGVIDQHAAKKAEAAGIKVIMDRCPKIEYLRLGPFVQD